MKKIAIVGSGATAIYLLKHLMDNTDVLKNHIDEIAIFEKGEILGMGMPYNPNTTDLWNLSNIASEEIPELMMPFVNWLRDQDKKTLKALGLADKEISKSEVYSRLALGEYLQDQYRAILTELSEADIKVQEFPNSEVVDIVPLA
ncbi:MAG: FAD/NAD(P)-binding protein, partial [Bacteroidetes bacterium]|nr:FAD/NAD(P)-binding protein [Bacteroidota bacterium]